MISPPVAHTLIYRTNADHVALAMDRAVYVPVPGAGESVIGKVLARRIGLPVGSTLDFAEVRFPQFADKIPGDFFAFTFVRNPCDRVAEFYRKHIHGEKLPPQLAGERAFRVKMPFVEFVSAIADDGLRERYPELREQVCFLQGPPLRFVGRCDDLDADLRRLAEMLGWPRNILPKPRDPGNSGLDPAPDGTAGEGELFDAGTLKLVQEIYAEDFAQLEFSAGANGLRGSANEGP